MKLLCSLSLDAYKRVKNELFPEELEGITYVRVRETLVKIFRKSTNIYKCRYEFNQVKKAEGEDVDGFINRLKEAARKYLSCDRGKSYVCGDAQGQDDSGRSSHSESMVSETMYSVGQEYKVLKSSECTVRHCETFVVE